MKHIAMMKIIISSCLSFIAIRVSGGWMKNTALLVLHFIHGRDIYMRLYYRGRWPQRYYDYHTRSALKPEILLTAGGKGIVGDRASCFMEQRKIRRPRNRAGRSMQTCLPGEAPIRRKGSMAFDFRTMLSAFAGVSALALARGWTLYNLARG